MRRLSTETFPRPADIRGSTPTALYVRSYLLTRTVVGVVGVALPTLLLLMDWLVLGGDLRVRGSLSAYYHSSARDVFVGALCVIGVLLVTYLAGQPDTWDFWLSATGGAAAIGVALMPVERPGLGPGAPRCGSEPAPAGCAGLPQALGEGPVSAVHYVCAAVFILSLAATCFLFARRARMHGGGAGRVRLFRGCGIAILGAVAWIAVGGAFGLDLAGLTPLYLGEVVCAYAFGLGWLVSGADLWRRLLPDRVARILGRR